MTRTRSEYRAPLSGRVFSAASRTRAVATSDRDGLARLLLDAYRGTIDDEGESLDDAFDAIDEYFELLVAPHSFVGEGDTGELAAMSLVVVVDGLHYIDPVAVSASAKRRGLGRAMVATSLASLAAAGIDVVGATITDGNVASERLFAALGFERVGGWG